MNPQIDSLVQQIASQLNPEKIILFGSRAKGQETPDSDVDLLIIYDGPLSKRDVKLRVRAMFPLPDFSLDLFVLSSSEYARQQNVVSTIGREASRHGMVCHG